MTGLDSRIRVGPIGPSFVMLDLGGCRCLQRVLSDPPRHRTYRLRPRDSHVEVIVLLERAKRLGELVSRLEIDRVSHF